MYKIEDLSKEPLISKLKVLSGENKTKVIDRITGLAEDLYQLSGKKEFYIISSPGRTEICGNHTDHNNGKVLAAAVDLDMIALISPEESSIVTVKSEGYDNVFSVNINNPEKKEELYGTTESLILGTASGFEERGYRTGGFSACISSNVMPGSGLSSSASIEVLFAMAFNVLYNDQKVPDVELAKIGQYAENIFFNKACGLMDQLACACGSGVAIDFINEKNPFIENIDIDFRQFGYSLIIVDTGGSHDDLVAEYELIPDEMKKVAKWFGKENCRAIDRNEILKNLKEIREVCGDRAVLRALHFEEENDRVDICVQSLKNKNFDTFLETLNASGLSSLSKLQNCIVPGSANDQKLIFALEMTRSYFSERALKGSFRVHGGGFAGTIQVILPVDEVNEYKKYMSEITGPGSVIELNIRQDGVICL